jgi:protease-4
MSGRVGVDTGLIDAVGGELEAQAWLEAERDVPKDLQIVTAWPLESSSLGWIGTFLGGQARAALGLPANGAITLDGLVSLWQVGAAS